MPQKKTALYGATSIGILPGQYYDEETGLHYNYHRYYDPQTGRYLTPDPIGLAGGLNLFAYAGGNPVNRIDPMGLSGTLRMCSKSGDSSTIFDGHSWISYSHESGGETTYGTWGNTHGAQRVHGLNRDTELGWYKIEGVDCRSKEINDPQEDQLIDIINNQRALGSDGWQKLSPCSDFASDTWNSITGEHVADRNLFGISTPSQLSSSTKRWNSGNQDNGKDWCCE